MMCGLGASLGALLSNPTALGSLKSLVKTVDEIFPAIVRLRDGALGRRSCNAFLRVRRRAENRGMAGGRPRRALRNRRGRSCAHGQVLNKSKETTGP
jgi:hypothetical protein